MGIVILNIFGLGLIFSYAQTNEIKTPAEETKAEPQEASPKTEEGAADLKDPFISFLPSKQKEVTPEISTQEQGPQAGEEEKFDYSSLNVTGLVWGTEKPKAIINGEVVGIGDVINEAEILNISDEGILFKYKDKEYLRKRQSLSGRTQEAK